MLIKHTRMSAAIIAALAITACSYQPPQRDLDKALPADVVAQQTADTEHVQWVKAPQQTWWTLFQTQELDALLQELNANSLDLHIAQQRIQQSRALLGQKTASNYPSVVIGANHNNQRNHETDTGTDSHDIGLTVSYEVDLWGGRDAANTAAELAVVEQEQNLNSLALQLQSQVAQQYFSLLANKEKLNIAKQNLEASESLLSLIRTRYELGSASRIELNQQHNLLLQQQVRITELQRDIILEQRSLAVLLGRDNINLLSTQASFTDIQIPAVQVVQPATLLQSRPDIRLAETQLYIADAQVYEARKRRWPSLKLTGQLTSNNTFESNDFMSSSLLASLTAPLFDAGNIRNQITAAEIATEIALKQYRNTVLIAMQETQDALTRLQHQRQIFALTEQEWDNSKQLFELARTRYDAGNIDFVQLLNAQQSWFSANEKKISVQQGYINSTINTFKAMGNVPVTDNNNAE